MLSNQFKILLCLSEVLRDAVPSSKQILAQCYLTTIHSERIGIFRARFTNLRIQIPALRIQFDVLDNIILKKN